MKRKIVYLGLWTNIGDLNTNINNAIKCLQKQINWIQEAKRYITEPMYYRNQDKFLNTVIKWEYWWTPEWLLKICKNIEEKLWRTKNFRNWPRIIDIDILLFWDEKYESELLIIPHIWISERDFVLFPLYDLDKNLIIEWKSVKDLINNLNYNRTIIPIQ